MKPAFKWLSITLVMLFVSGITLLFFFVKQPLLKDVSFSQTIYAEKQQLLRLTLSKDDKYRVYTPLNNIAAPLIACTLLEEDQYFHWHMGFNPIALLKAAWETYVTKSRRMGASTVTMQVARLRFGIHSKTLMGKISQIIKALEIELRYNKKEILEAYLNLAPYGNNIEGIGAASLIYYGKPAAKLTLPEALTLSVIPQHPSQRTPAQQTLSAIRHKLFQRWLLLHPEDQGLKANLDLPMQMQTIHHLPYYAPQFVNTVLSSAYQPSLQTTLDLRLQKIVEHVTRNYLIRKQNLGVSNAAVLLVDTRDMSIKALMGSSDYFNKTIQGQLNGTNIKRSPGSTLKPFIYGLALDQGLIHPNTVLKDVPHSFGSYNPENFDYDFMGPIKAKDALVLSRNIPAIYLASQLKEVTLYQLLENAHIKHLKPESYYGLALVLGGAELTMQELVSLYAMLANGGLWKPLRSQFSEAPSTGQRLLSPEASFLVLDMLKNTPRPAEFSRIAKNSLPISWKTGTSSGFRDAWTIGIAGPYVLAVWIGNFNNASNHAFVGKTMAAPLFFELITALQGDVKTFSSPIIPRNLTQIAVCKASGLLPTRYCHDTELTWFIPGKSPIKTDTIFREVAIDKQTGLRTCHINQQTQFVIYEFWSSDLLKIFKTAGIARRTPPPFDASCELTDNTGFIPQISSPRLEASYILRANQVTSLQIPLTAIADADVKDLYWFINETYLGKISRDQAFLWKAKAGKFVIRVVDDHGRAAARDLQVQVST